MSNTDPAAGRSMASTIVCLVCDNVLSIGQGTSPEVRVEHRGVLGWAHDHCAERVQPFLDHELGRKRPTFQDRITGL